MMRRRQIYVSLLRNRQIHLKLFAMTASLAKSNNIQKKKK